MSDNNNEMTEISNVKEEGVKEGVKDKPVTTDNPKTPSSASTNVIVKEEKEFKSLTKDEVATLDYKDFTTPARMLALGDALAGSKLCIHKTKEDFAVAMLFGQELGLPLSACLSSIYAIEGKATLGVHLQRALILKAGVIYEKIEDAVYIYEFVKTDKEGKTILKEVKTPENKIVKVPVIIGKGTLKEQPENSAKKPIDTRTTYEFTRLIKRQDNSYKEMKAKGSFTISEAKQAGLMDKSNYQKYPKRMLDARAWTNGAREIANDIIHGIMTPAEMGADVFYTEAGEEHIEDISHTEIN